ncbi:MAG: RimK family protein [Verrucomicrobiota bacterium]|jgi:glutathione synthase/RimK-type ligase-like ATP-grasp enzyme
MPDVIVVVENQKDWKADFPQVRVTTAKEYLGNPEFVQENGLYVINLCRSLAYLGMGYYCSLLAEARGHRVIPSVRTSQDLSRPAAFSPRDGLDGRARRLLRGLESRRYDVNVYFGTCEEPAFAGIAREVFDTFRAPLLRITFRRAPQWRLHEVRAIGIQQIPASQRGTFANALEEAFSRRWREPRSPRQYQYDLAILYDPEEALPPSNKKAIKKFIEYGRNHGLDVELITQRDFARLSEFDALFIRTTTQVNQFSYRFARRAEREGMVVIDDPLSILRCTNKVYLAELLNQHKINTPATVILTEDNLDQAEEICGYPVVLKVPDGSFSRGVSKAENRRELERVAADMFQHSELILAQAYTYTEFDWRVGVLNRKPIFVSKYFMAKKHWQIVKHGPRGIRSAGTAETLPVEKAPKNVVRTAVRAANLIGDGLYGVDLKETPNGIVVIEVNDNPNIDCGVEDQFLGDALYGLVMREFRRRLDEITFASKT